MKKQKTIITWCVLALIILEELLKYNYYKYLFNGQFRLGDGYKALDMAYGCSGILLNGFMLVLAIGSLGNSDAGAKDRTYSLFRFVVVMKVIMIFPITVLKAVIFTGNMNLGYTFLFYFRNLAEITLAVFMIFYKPEKQIEKVNLREYDYVTFTSGGHRFAHYLLDMLFLVPFWVYMLQTLSIAVRYFWRYNYGGETLELVLQAAMFTSYIVYCFLSEAIFRQTLGKMVTRSVVVSDGVELTTGRIFRRTLARLIPFDRISFLFGAKWHDRASSTAVVYIDTWENAFAEKQDATGVTA